MRFYLLRVFFFCAPVCQRKASLFAPALNKKKTVIVDALSDDDKSAADKGISEGFQLVSIDLTRFSLAKTVESVELECKDLLARNAEVTLGFVSPMDKEPPNLSDRQCSKRLGMNEVKKMHLTKVTDALRERAQTRKGVSPAEFRDIIRHRGGMYWLEKQDIRVLFRAIDQDSSENVSLDEWEEALQSTFIMDEHAFQHLGKHITRYHILAITHDLERRMMASPNRKVNASQFCAALYSAGISWLTREQMKIMFDLIDENRDGAISMAEWIARFKWSADEAVHEVQRLIDQNVESREAQRRNGVASASTSWRIPKTMNLKQFSACLFYQGIRWLTQEQIECIFAKVDRNNDGQISADEWRQIKTLAFA
eukprot:GEMP01055419.1.p1 GENE.GEMP01055419.1~~GEMP01055419.1.p1  ORF type:complete len:368 (+),score=81.72 GEMP01055419.1:143-1246(+)